MNISEVYPIVKDPLKDTTDPNNIRPISVAGVLINIFERLIMIEINKRYVG